MLEKEALTLGWEKLQPKGRGRNECFTEKKALLKKCSALKEKVGVQA